MKPDNNLKLLYGIFIGLFILLGLAGWLAFEYFKNAICAL